MIRHSAIKRDAIVYVGRRHHDCIRYMREMGIPAPATRNSDGTRAVQGFVTHAVAFLDRRDAYRHAVECGQIEHVGGSNSGTLYSEDLW